MRKQMFGGGLPRLALGLLATLVMALGLCPATGFADELVQVEPGGEPVVVAQGEDEPALEEQVVTHTHDGIEFTAWESDSSLPNDTGNYYLTKDVTLSDRRNVWSGTTIRLCLNGHKVTLANDDARIYVYGTLELYDEEGGNGTIDGGNKVRYSCVCVVNNGPYVSLFNMHGGTITGGGSANSYSGGGVSVTSRATFNMSGGTITGNTAKQGGGVYEEGGATFNMSGGTITGNTAAQGGGVYVAGGRDYGDDEIFPSAAMSVSGDATVSGNTNNDGAASNVFVGQGMNSTGSHAPDLDAKITVAGALSDGASFGVTMPKPGTFTVGFKDKTGDADPAKYFASDDDGCIVTRDADGEGKLAWGYSVKVAEGIQNGAVRVDKERAAAGDSVKIIATPADGYELDTVTVTEPGGRPVGTKDGSFTMPADDVTVSATFKKKAPATHKVTVNATAGGTATASTAEASEGGTVTLTATPASGYEFDRWVIEGKSDAVLKSADSATTELTVGTADVTVTANFKEKAAPEPTPAKPAKVAAPSTVAHVAAGSIDVSWKKAKGAKSYQVQWRVAGAKKWSTATVKGTKKTITGLKAGKLYDVRVRGVDGSAKGAWSTPARQRWLRSVSKAKAKPGTSKGSVKVTWKKDKSATGGYQVRVYAKKGGKAVATKTVSKSKASATITNLKSGKTYYVRVRPLKSRSGKTYVGALCGYRSAVAK